LPAARPDGVVLTIPDGVTGPGEPIRARVQTGKTERTLLVGGYTRGRLFDHRRVTVKPGAAQEVVLTPRSEAGGVVRVTVFEEAGEEQVGRLPVTPVAERLVF